MVVDRDVWLAVVATKTPSLAISKGGGTVYEEMWVEARDHPRYLVSNHGRVVERMSGRMLTQSSTNGYVTVRLFSPRGLKQIGVHRLVHLSFYESDLVGLDVNHIDGVKTDNTLWNLEACTPEENRERAVDTGLVPEQYRPIRVINLDTGEVFGSLRLAAKSVGVTSASLSHTIRKPGRTSNGFRFERVIED